MLDRVLRKTLVGVCVSMLAVSIAISKASAQVKPSDVITPENATRVQNLVSPAFTTWSSTECR